MGHSNDSELTRSTYPRFISVVIPAFNAAGALSTQLEALANQTYQGSWEVIVADNRSTDDTRMILDAWEDKLPLHVVGALDRKGSNYSRNVGAKAAKGDLLLFCDADDVADSRWIEAMAKAATTSDLLGGRLEHETLNDPKVRSWRTPSQRDGLRRSHGFLPYAGAGNCGVRAAVFSELGGWNEDFHSGGDPDFFWRAQLASYRLSFVPDAVIHYRHRTALRSLARQYYVRGLGATRLYRDFRPLGVPKKRIRGGLKVWLWILLHAPGALVFSANRPRFVRKTAYRLGLLRGSLRHRVLCL